MMYLLDTNVVSEFARRREWQDPNVRRWLMSVPSGRIGIPASAVIELEFGIAHLAVRNKPKADALYQWLETLLSLDLPYLTVSVEAARLYARMTLVPALRHLWQSAPGKRLRGPAQDLMIAALAITSDACVVTMDEKDFLLVHDYFALPGLLNPSTGRWLVGKAPENPIEEKFFHPPLDEMISGTHLAIHA